MTVVQDSLAPGLLVAAPSMQDPDFAEAVILLAESSEDGAVGFVLNRPSPFSMKDLAEDLSLQLQLHHEGQPVYRGGPVSPERGWVLFRGDSQDAFAEQEHVFSVEGEIRIAATLEVLGRFLQPETEQPFRLLLGYAGWGPGQLEGEIHRGDWIPMEVDDSLVFDADTSALWRKALERLGLHPGGFMVGPGGKA